MKIKQLRYSLSISLMEAKALLKEHNNDVAKCIEFYHQQNIKTICRLTQCAEEVAHKFYKLSQHNVEKAIKKIHEQPFYLTAHPNEPIGKIGFVLWSENENLEKYKSMRDKSLFIAERDFDILKSAFDAVFPLKDETGEIQDYFCRTSDNVFDHQTCKVIVQNLARIKTKNEQEEQFLKAIIVWFQSQLRFADEIIVYGNL